MTPFLKQVAQHYYDAGNLDSTCLVFPNRRSMAFMRKWLCDAVAADPDARPLTVPRMITMSDLFSRACGVEVADRVRLLLLLYKCYSALCSGAEPLDEFVFWGDVILADFSDTDKYLADPKVLFTNVADFRGMQDAFSYLEEDQRAAIESFVRHFRQAGPKEGMKERFLAIWNLLLPLYEAFGEALREEGLAYEGLLYRRLADRLDSEGAADIFAQAFPGADRFVFVGLNALSTAERKVLRKMRSAAMAEFCWDYSGEMVRDPHNRSSLFMARNVEEFPQAFSFDEGGLGVPEVHVVSVPSSVGQAKQVPAILGQMGDLEDLGRIGSGSECAVVLPDESLLPSLLNSIPPGIKDINVTMGSPMAGSAFSCLMAELLTMQLRLRLHSGEYCFYHRNVWNVLSSSVVRRAMDEGDKEVAKEIKRAAKFYVPRSDFGGSELFALLFRPVVSDPSAADPSVVAALGQWQQEVVMALAPRLIDEDMGFETEVARRYLRCVGQLSLHELPVLPATYIRLLGQIIAGESIPYEGEPLGGLQIMGPLEIRALDFPNLIVLSCNEGVFPRRSVSASFIPPELRRGFGLPTYEHQDAVWAYYFYRMIQRAEHVWLLYDSRTEKMKPGEESRYIKQLRYHFRVPIRIHVAMAPAGQSGTPPEIAKPANIREILQGRELSASALDNYLRCGAKFYYHTVERLRGDTEVAESLDAGMIGNVFHSTMQALYLGPEAMDPGFDMKTVREAVRQGRLKPLRSISREYITSWIRRPGDIRARIRSLICDATGAVEVAGRDLIKGDVILQYVLRTLKLDLSLLKESGRESFDILGLELERHWTFGGFRFVGYIDRLDSFSDGKVRIVDYKTGKIEAADVEIDDEKAADVVARLFDPGSKKHPKVAIQLFLYGQALDGDPIVAGGELVNTIYATSELFSGRCLSAARSRVFGELMEEGLGRLLDEIADPSVPFTRTDNEKTCEYCDFKDICGK